MRKARIPVKVPSKQEKRRGRKKKSKKNDGVAKNGGMKEVAACIPGARVETPKSGGDAGLQNITAANYPPEVWEMIFRYISSVEDAMACSIANKFWAADMHWKWILLMLIQGHFLSKEEIFKCRLVCRKWRRSVDRHLKTYVHFGDINPPGAVYFENEKKVFKFLSEMTLRTGNPFPSGAIEFSPSLETQRDEDALVKFYKSFRHLVNKFGKYIYHVNFALRENCTTSLEQFCNIFYTIPNIHSLRVLIHPTERELAVQAIDQLKAAGMPRLPNLQALTLVDTDYMPSVWRHFLFETYGSQLEHASCNWSRDEYDSEEETPSVFSKLKQLSMQMRDTGCLGNFLDYAGPSGVWPLKTLILEGACIVNAPKILHRDIVRTIKMFAPTLEELNIYFDYVVSRIWTASLDNENTDYDMSSSVPDELEPVPCPNLKYISFPYVFLNSPLFQWVLDACPDLRSVKMYLCANGIHQNRLYGRYQEFGEDEIQVIYNLWKHLPPTMETVSVLTKQEEMVYYWSRKIHNYCQAQKAKPALEA